MRCDPAAVSAARERAPRRVVDLLANHTNYNHFLIDTKYRSLMSLLLHFGGLVGFFLGSRGSIISHSRSDKLLVYGIFRSLYSFSRSQMGSI